MFLSVMEIVSNSGSPDSLLTVILGAIIALLVFAAIKKRYDELERFRKHPAWSLVQPFEE